MRQLLTIAAVLALVASFSIALPTANAQPAGTDVAAAKQRFETGLKLMKEGLLREALAAFVDAKRLAPRESIQRNIAHALRELKEFGAAHDAYLELLQTYGAKMNEAARKKVEVAIEELRMMTGELRVEVSEPGARVLIDGREVGVTPLGRTLRMNLRSYEVRVVKDGFETLAQHADFQAGNQEIVVKGPLVKLAATGRLAASVESGGPAKLFVDGIEIGHLPFEGELDPGVHEVVARAKNAASPPRKIEVLRGKRTEIVLQLVNMLGTVRVDPADSEALILVDGRSVGKGAWDGELEPGRHEVEIRRPGFRSHKRTVLVAAGQVATVGNVTFAATNPDIAQTKTRQPPPPHDYRGAYVQIAAFGAFAIGGARDDVFDPCRPKQLSVGACTIGMPAGGGLAVRVGHSFGWSSIEGLLLAEADTWTTRTTYTREVYPQESSSHAGVARDERFHFYRIGAGVGAGGRLTSKSSSLRFTAGLAFGMLHRQVGYEYVADSTQREGQIADTTTHSSSFAPYWMPVALLDAGVLVGSTPGTKLTMGFQLQHDLGGSGGLFADGNDTEELEGRRVGLPRTRVAKAEQWFAGPVLGIQFGE